MKRVLSTCLMLAFATAAKADPPTPTRLTFDDANSLIETDGGRNAVVSQEGNLFVVWSDDRDGNFEIYLKERLGNVWISDLRLTNDPAISSHPAIGRTSSGELRIVWEDTRTGHPEIWIKRKIPKGSWGVDQCVTCDSFSSERPSMEFGGRYFAWEEAKDGNYEIYSRSWFDGSFGPELRVSNNGAESRLPSVAGTFQPIVAWQDLRDGNWEIYSRTLVSPGPETRVSFDSGSSTHPSVMEATVVCGDIAINKNFVAWQDDRLGNERIFQAEGESGSWFSPGDLVSMMPGPSIHPSFTLEYEAIYDKFQEGYVYCDRPVLAWEEHSLNALPKIFLRKDFGSGTEEIPVGAWPSDPILVTWRAGGERTLEMVWTEQIDGNPEIYHASIVEQHILTGAGEPEVELAGLQLGHPRPNPFQQNTRIPVRIAQAGPLNVGIYDTAGRLVQRLHEGWIFAGAHDFTWHQNGVAAGTYTVRVQTRDGSAARKVQLIR